MQEVANLMAELLVGRRGLEVQMEDLRISFKVEKPNNYDGSKGRDIDTWLFHVREHLNLTIVPERGHVPYATSLLCKNAVLWWPELCESNHYPGNWEEFCRGLCE